MTSIFPVQCYGCARLDRSVRTSTGVVAAARCEAYPGGIPEDIGMFGVDHRTAFGGETGGLLYAALDTDAGRDAFGWWQRTFDSGILVAAAGVVSSVQLTEALSILHELRQRLTGAARDELDGIIVDLLQAIPDTDAHMPGLHDQASHGRQRTGVLGNALGRLTGLREKLDGADRDKLDEAIRMLQGLESGDVDDDDLLDPEPDEDDEDEDEDEDDGPDMESASGDLTFYPHSDGKLSVEWEGEGLLFDQAQAREVAAAVTEFINAPIVPAPEFPGWPEGLDEQGRKDWYNQWYRSPEWEAQGAVGREMTTGDGSFKVVRYNNGVTHVGDPESIEGDDAHGYIHLDDPDQAREFARLLTQTADQAQAATVTTAAVSTMPAQLQAYWLTGEGAAKVRWCTPGSFRRARRLLLKEGVPAHMVDGTVANLYRKACGKNPGRHRSETGLNEGMLDVRELSAKAMGKKATGIDLDAHLPGQHNQSDHGGTGTRLPKFEVLTEDEYMDQFGPPADEAPFGRGRQLNLLRDGSAHVIYGQEVDVYQPLTGLLAEDDLERLRGVLDPVSGGKQVGGGDLSRAVRLGGDLSVWPMPQGGVQLTRTSDGELIDDLDYDRRIDLYYAVHDILERSIPDLREDAANQSGPATAAAALGESLESLPGELWHAVVHREGVSTGKRTWLPGSVEWREPPFAAHHEVISAAHGSSPVTVYIGNVTRVVRDGPAIHLWGDVDLGSDTGMEWARRLVNGYGGWPSFGPGSEAIEYDVVHAPAGPLEEPEQVLFRRYRMGETTFVSVPGQENTFVEALPALIDAMGAKNIVTAGSWPDLHAHLQHNQQDHAGGGDALKLGSRMRLSAGERLRSSRRIKPGPDSEGIVLAAELDTPGGRRIRLGVVPRDEVRGWAANVDTARTEELRALLDGMDEDDDRYEDLHGELTAAESSTVLDLPTSAVRQLQTEIDSAVRAATSWAKEYDAALAADDDARLEALGEPTFADGVVPVGTRGDVAFRVEAVNSDHAQWYVGLGVRPPDAGDDWSVLDGTYAEFGANQVPGLLKDLAELGVPDDTPVTAGGGSSWFVEIPNLPPADWFREPESYPYGYAVTMLDDGHIFGLIAPHNEAHRTYARMGEKRTLASLGKVDFSRWAKETIVEGGKRVLAGPLTMECMHAPKQGYGTLDRRNQYYEDSCSIFARVAVGNAKNGEGHWLSGAAMPGVTAEQVLKFLACGVSGDWQPHPEKPGWVELVAVLAVPAEGWPKSKTGVPSPVTRIRETEHGAIMVASAVPTRFEPSSPAVDASVVYGIAAAAGVTAESRVRAEAARIEALLGR